MGAPYMGDPCMYGLGLALRQGGGGGVDGYVPINLD